MSHSLARAAPIRFLLGVAAAWTTARGVALVGWEPAPPSALSLRRGNPAGPPVLAAGAAPPWFTPDRQAPPFPPARTHVAAARQEALAMTRGPLASPDAIRAAPPLALAAVSPESDGAYRRASGLAEPATTAGQSLDRRWSGSAWAFLRAGGRATMLSPGQIGGGQAGARILYRITRHLSAAGRFSAAIGGARQTETAFGLDWKPIDTLPVHLMAERRIAIDRGGRNAWTLGTAGGVDDVRIVPGWRLDGYGEAGVVGARRRDLYADGATRIARAIGLGGGTSLALGGGLWGAAQPHASRLDIGPSVVMRLPVDHHAVAVALDWRERVMGSAKPGSGVALTVATDF